MRNLNLFIYQKIIIFIILNLSKQMLYFPDEYKQGDLIIPQNDKAGEYQYNLVVQKF